MKMIGFLYGVFSYTAFIASSLYTIGFVGNFLVPKSIDSGPSAPLGAAFAIDAVLLGFFALQHSVMARPAFKNCWTRIIPQSVERSTYVLSSSLILALLFWKWEAMAGVIWNVENQAGQFGLKAIFWVGWLIVVQSTFMISHSDLFGLRQVYLRLQSVEYMPLEFKPRALYRFVRHPIMLGYLVAFWATAHMTQGHLLFSLAMTAYIFTGIFLEERDLAAAHDDVLDQYRKDVPMIIPRFRR
jgi:protein-S-isoprenylcysteine O-methyltransferase Ste14